MKVLLELIFGATFRTYVPMKCWKSRLSGVQLGGSHLFYDPPIQDCLLALQVDYLATQFS